MDSQSKPASRFSTLNVFGKFTSKPPRPPPKDKWYSQGSKSVVSLAPSHALSMHTASIASSSHDTLHLQLPQTPFSLSAAHSQSDLTRTMSPVSTHSHATMSSSMTNQSQASEMSSFRRGFSKISSSFGRKPKLFMRSNASRATFDSAIIGGTEDGLEEDMSVSKPYNVQHHLHVDEGLSQIPQEWLDQLRKEGIKDIDILSIHSRRNRTTYLQHHPDISPESIRSRSDSPYSPSISSSIASSASPSSFSPPPPSSYHVPPLSLRRAPQQDDTSSVSTGTHSTGSDHYSNTNSPFLPSSTYSFNRRTSLSATSVHTEDDEGDPRTATASQFPSISQPSQSPVDSTQLEIRHGDRSPRTPPSRAGTATFRVVNGDPPSPPPAYGPLERSSTVKGMYRDEKSAHLHAGPSNNEARSIGSDLAIERHSEETVTPEVLLRGENGVHDASNASSAPPRFSLAISQSPKNFTASPPSSPVSKTMPKAPRLSLHQDDLSDWSASLFSAMSSPGLGSLSENSTLATASGSGSSGVKTTPTKPSETGSLDTKKTSIPPLLLTSPSNDITISVESDEIDSTESEHIELGKAGRSTQLFNEVLSLVQFSSEQENPTSPLASTYPYLPSPPIPSSVESHFSPKSYEFLNSSYDSSPNRASGVPSMTSSRDSQVTISTESRWSRATTVRDVRDATIAHVRKTSVANAITVPAPVSTANRSNLQQPSTSTLRGTPISTEERPLSITSSDGASATFPCAEDFPLPPPSPNDGGFAINSVQASPLSATFSAESGSELTSLSYARDALHSPASVRSSQSSSGSGSSSSSQAKPLSVTSGSEDSPPVRSSVPLRVELQYTGSESDGSILSPTESETGGRWENKDELKVGQISITAELCEDQNRRFSEDVVSDGASAVVDWLVDAPSPHYETHGRVRRDSDTVYSPRREPLSAKMQTLAAPDANKTSQNFLCPSSASNLLPIPRSVVSPSPPSSPRSLLPPYKDWVSDAIEPLNEFIDDTVNPLELFTELQEVAEGESGFVYSATVIGRSLKKRGAKVQKVASGSVVAIKSVTLRPNEELQKINDLRKELLLMCRVRHPNILSMESLYVNSMEDTLWVEMELMDRSLADVLTLVDEGLELHETVIAAFASDIFNALAHLEGHGIVHRDVRSDNLLVNSQGVLKLTDFTQALLVDSQYPMYDEPAGVIYWQAPEMRNGSYDARKVDVWSAGATVWEMAEARPPFIEYEDLSSIPTQWPSLSQVEIYTQSFHDFLSHCSSPSNIRPSANDLITTPFLQSACSRSDILSLLGQCKSMEESSRRRQSTDSQGTVLS